MNQKLKIVLVGVLVMLIQHTMAQTSKSSQLVDYTFSIIENIEWPTQQSEFNVHVITTDESLRKEFEKAAQSRKIEGVPFSVGFTNYVVIPQEVDAIVVSSAYNATIPNLLDRVSGKPILFITDRYEVERDVMINFINSASGEFSFEINTANINNQGLMIKPGMKDLGGREINLAKIFKQVRDSVRAMEFRAKDLKEQYDSINLNIAVAMRLASSQDKIILERTADLKQKQQEIYMQSKRLDSLSSQFAKAEENLTLLANALDGRERDLKLLEGEIKAQKENVSKGNVILAEQNQRIEQQNQAIKEREGKLQEMTSVVDSQKSALTFLVLFLVAVVGLTFFIFSAYRARKKAAKVLAEQKEELSQLLHELQNTQSQLVQSEKMASLGVLTAGIAHEINNAINFVYSGIHVLDSKFKEIEPVFKQVVALKKDDENIPETVEQLVEKRDEIEYESSHSVINQMINSIRIGAERTTEIVKGLRIFSRADNQKKTKIDLYNDLDVALLLLKSKHKDSITIHQNLAEGQPQVDGFHGQLSQVFLNIIGNAIDSIEEAGVKGEINIATKLEKESVEIRIKDNGTGMDEERKRKIFDPFFTTKKIGAGTGLGLSITYGIIERHDGTIRVNSEVGNGAEFVIKLPTC